MDKSQEVFEKMMQKDYCSQWMGIVPKVIEEGHCVIRMKVRKEMLNGFGILHGGIAYAFADSAFAFASNSYGRVAVSINGSMNFVKPAREGDVLLAEARQIHVGNRTAEFDVVVSHEKTGDNLYFFRGMVFRKDQNVISEETN